jgi:tubulin-specific chaperone A
MIREVNFYKEEVKENEAKLAEMKASNQDPYDIKKFEEVLGESYMMIPDSCTRLKQTLQGLASYIETSELPDEFKSNEWYQQAVELLEQERSRYEDPGEVLEETRVNDLGDGEAF